MDYKLQGRGGGWRTRSRWKIETELLFLLQEALKDLALSLAFGKNLTHPNLMVAHILVV